MKYLSVCSGIEAASVAWHSMGWSPVAFAEIEKFPSAVLAHHYPSVPNWGDLTKFKDWPDAAIDLLVGGTPCQSFSVAGLRKGMADPRGNLALTYLAVLDRYRPEWCLWENVPGVLSSGGGRDFGSFLGALGQLGYGFAYRVLDAQYFGVAQRRRRVFVVGCSRGWQRAAAVLFDGASMRGNPAPRREAGKGIAPSLAARTKGGGGLGTDAELDGALIPATVGALCDGAHMGGVLTDRTRTPDGSSQYPPRISLCLNAGAMGRIDAESETLIPIGGSFDVAHSLTGNGFDASEDGTGRGTPTVPIDMRQASRGEKLTNNRSHGSGGAPGVGVGNDGDPAFTVTERTQAIAFSAKDHGADAGSISPTLRSGGHNKSHANGGCMPAGAFDARQSDVLQYGEKTGPLDTDGHTMGIQTAMQVRRLTPRECERLQGFPDDYTLIEFGPRKTKLEEDYIKYLTRGGTLTREECFKRASDGPRYKALGNSMAVPCMAWIGRRINEVANLADVQQELAESAR